MSLAPLPTVPSRQPPVVPAVIARDNELLGRILRRILQTGGTYRIDEYGHLCITGEALVGVVEADVIWRTAVNNPEGDQCASSSSS